MKIVSFILLFLRAYIVYGDDLKTSYRYAWRLSFGWEK